LQGGDVAGRDLVDDVHIARLHGGAAGRVVRDQAIDDPVPVRLGTPVVLIPDEYDPVAQHDGFQLVRPGADRGFPGVEVGGGRTLGGLLADDPGAGQVVG